MKDSHKTTIFFIATLILGIIVGHRFWAVKVVETEYRTKIQIEFVSYPDSKIMNECLDKDGVFTAKKDYSIIVEGVITKRYCEIPGQIINYY